MLDVDALRGGQLDLTDQESRSAGRRAAGSMTAMDINTTGGNLR